MSARLAIVLTALSGLLGVLLLGVYFGVGIALGLASLPPTATMEQVVALGTRYHTQWFLGTWLQATGTTLCLVFFLALVERAGWRPRLAAMLTLVGAAVLVAVVLLEGVFTLDLAQAATNGHTATALTSFDVMTVFTYLYPLAPAPLIFLPLGVVLRNSRVLPGIFGTLALVLGCAFLVAGLLGLFTTPILTLVVLALQSLWILAAALTLCIARWAPADRAG